MTRGEAFVAALLVALLVIAAGSLVTRAAERAAHDAATIDARRAQCAGGGSCW